MKRIVLCLLAAALLLPLLSAGAESVEVLLPDGVSSLRMPADIIYQEPSAEETDLRGIFLMPPDLEILVFAYQMPGITLQTLAEGLDAAGRNAQIRSIGAENFLVFQDQDEADGAVCVGYSYLAGDWMIEISFFCGSQAAMDMSREIMETYSVRGS